MNARGLPIILIAEDDLGDRALIEEAFHEVSMPVDLRFVSNGAELLDYLHQHQPWRDVEIPDLIVLDLKMPYRSSEVLSEIKDDPRFKAIPVVVLSHSRADEDIADAYHRGANTYITKPTGYAELVDLLNGLCNYWFKLCALPEGPGRKPRPGP